MIDNYGIIPLETIEELIQMREKHLYLQKHNNKIWQGKNGKWYTYVSDRKLVKRNSYDDIVDYICNYYAELEDNPTVEDLFTRWLDFKLQMGEIRKGSYERYICDWNRFFRDTTLSLLKIKLVSEDDLDIFIRETIANHEVTQKAYSNLRSLIIGIFKYAKRNHYTELSIGTFFKDFDISKRVFKPKSIRENQIFTQDEIPILLTYLRKNSTIENLGLIFAFESGVRCGELAALKFTDLTDGVLHVQRQEVVYKSDEEGKQVHEVVDYTKTESGNRYIYLPSKCTSLMTAIKLRNGDSEYMFAKDGVRINKTSFNNYLIRACKKCGIPPRTMHKIRRTYGTTLIDNNVEDSLIMSQMGHTDISTTRKYYYFANKNDEYKRNQIEDSIRF